MNQSYKGIYTELPKTKSMNKEFQWTESAAWQFVGYYASRINQGETDLDKIMVEFKRRIMSQASHSVSEGGESKDWEIVSVKTSYNSILSGSEDIQLFIKGLKPEWSIFSVKRLSDNTTWTVGDTFLANAGCSLTIVAFEFGDPKIRHNLMKVQSKEYGYWMLDEIQKVPERKALFSTLDGVEVFEDSPEYLFYINDENWKVSKMLACNFWMSESKFNYKVEAMEELRKGFTPKVKWFSTEDAATDYINMNKPVICVNDIHHILLLLSQVNDRDINKYHYNEQIKKSVFATAQSKIKGDTI